MRGFFVPFTIGTAVDFQDARSRRCDRPGRALLWRGHSRVIPAKRGQSRWRLHANTRAPPGVFDSTAITWRHSEAACFGCTSCKKRRRRGEARYAPYRRRWFAAAALRARDDDRRPSKPSIDNPLLAGCQSASTKRCALKLDESCAECLWRSEGAPSRPVCRY